MTVPMLDETDPARPPAHGAREVVIGMAHRGRLNVLAHNLGRPYETIFAEFEGASTLEAVTDDPAGRHRRRQVPPRRPGHLPAARRRADHRQPRVQPVATSSSSHPVVVGATRAAQTDAPGPARPPRHQRRGPDHPARRRRLPRPGRRRRDAQPPGARRLPGRRHAAPDPEQPGRLHHRPRGRALDPWASDLAKGFDVPIIHVNADDVEACIAAVRLAIAFRQEFGHDVADRPDRLPPLRPQRGRRARLHAAGDVRARSSAHDARRASSTPSGSSRTASLTQEEVDALRSRRSGTS